VRSVGWARVTKAQADDKEWCTTNLDEMCTNTANFMEFKTSATTEDKRDGRAPVPMKPNTVEEKGSRVTEPQK
jgi:hypothetical protein